MLIGDASVVTSVSSDRIRAWLKRGLLENHGRPGRPKVDAAEVTHVAQGRRRHLEGTDWSLYTDGSWHLVNWVGVYTSVASARSAAHSWAKPRGLSSQTRGTRTHGCEPFEICFVPAGQRA
ncbi:hypothetical protein PV350_23565 [Streptomyces sp. PA03-6a]|nr:hypothetical protein [Streptomyces sp. PA03-6a]